MRMLTIVVMVSLAAAAVAAPPEEIAVQGLYEGTATVGGKESKLHARVVATGDRQYQVFIRQAADGGGIQRAEFTGKTQGDAVTFEGAGWKGAYADGTIKGSIGGGSFELKRTEPRSPTLGKKPPEGAVVLLDGKSFDNLVRRSGPWYLGPMERDGWGVWEVPIRTIAKEPQTWPSEDKVVPEGWELTKDRRRVDEVIGIDDDGSIRIPRGGMNSKPQFEGSFNAHVEFRVPFKPKDRGQGRGNSGVYLPCGQEIQVLDSFGMVTYKGGCCGGLYGMKDPDPMAVIESMRKQRDHKFPLASFPPDAWQTYDIEVRVRNDAQGKRAVFLTVYHNGIKIHDNVRLNRSPRKGSFHFQDHGNPVRYRNIWVLPVKDEPKGEF